jgi:hypothetical protein
MIFEIFLLRFRNFWTEIFFENLEIPNTNKYPKKTFLNFFLKFLGALVPVLKAKN